MKAVAILVSGCLVSASHAAASAGLQGTVLGQRALEANAKLREELLSKAVRVEETRGLSSVPEERQLQDEDFSKTWVSGYSLKFQGCHHISQWNDEADNEEDVRIATKRLVRFRMCPSNSCSSTNTVGCTEGYGDYVVDLNTYLYYYFNAKSTYQQYECEYLANYVCGCNDNNGNQAYCLWDCFSDHNMASVCMQNNPYNANNGYDANGQAEDYGNGFDLQDYMECTKSDIADQNGNALYIGPFCASQGGVIHLGVFTDDACTNFADSEDGRSAYVTATGYELPYAEANIIDLDCMSCIEPSDKNNAGNDAEDGDNVNEMCEKIYTMAGKCEASLAYGTTQYPNNNACNYLEGIKIVRADGTIVTADSRANKFAGAFIGIFTTMFVLLSAYVYFLKTKLDRASINISE
jgi:hypothetical protein